MAARLILEVIRDINRDGVTVLLVEQNARGALALAHRGYVMESGEITLSGRGRALLADPRVREAYLGESCRLGPQPPCRAAVVKRIGEELVLRQAALRDEIAPRRIDHDRNAAGVDLDAGRGRAGPPSPRGARSRSGRSSRPPASASEITGTYLKPGCSAAQRAGKRVEIEVLRTARAPVERHRPRRCPCAAPRRSPP